MDRMNDRIRASVIIPAYNAASTIDVQLAALANQRFAGRWEVVVADNGSTDGTCARALAWAEHVPGLRVVDASQRRGPAAARNIGVDHSVGEALLFCDADDAAESNWVTAMVGALEGADAASGSRRYNLLNDAPMGPADWSEPLFRKPPLTHLASASSHNLAVTADAYAAVGGFDETMTAGEDVDLCWRLQLSGFHLVGARDAAMQIRRRTGLRATFLQAFSYGRADRLLAAKFSSIEPAAAGTNTDPGPAQEDGSTEAEGVFARLRRRGLRPPDPIFAADRIGRALGARFGRGEDRVQPFSPPRRGTTTAGTELT